MFTIIGLSIVAGAILFGLMQGVMWAGENALNLRPLHRFKQWRKRRNARAVVKLRGQIKTLQADLREEKLRAQLAQHQLERIEAKHLKARIILHTN